MTTEERWAQKAEWARERGEIEIKSKRPILKTMEEMATRCDADPCQRRAVSVIKVGLVLGRHHDAIFYLCENHEEEALETYERYISDR